MHAQSGSENLWRNTPGGRVDGSYACLGGSAARYRRDLILSSANRSKKLRTPGTIWWLTPNVILAAIAPKRSNISIKHLRNCIWRWISTSASRHQHRITVVKGSRSRLPFFYRCWNSGEPSTSPAIVPRLAWVLPPEFVCTIFGSADSFSRVERVFGETWPARKRSMARSSA